MRGLARWHASCIISVRIGDAVAIPKEGKTMKKLTTRFMIAAAALVVGAGAASAQIGMTITAQIPFEFRVGNQILAPGTYAVDRLVQSSAPVFRLWNARLRRSAILLPQAKVDPQTGWAEGSPKLVFACTSGSCALAQLWSGSKSCAYAFSGRKLGKGEEAYLREVPLQPGKGE